MWPKHPAGLHVAAGMAQHLRHCRVESVKSTWFGTLCMLSYRVINLHSQFGVCADGAERRQELPQRVLCCPGRLAVYLRGEHSRLSCPSSPTFPPFQLPDQPPHTRQQPGSAVHTNNTVVVALLGTSCILAIAACCIFCHLHLSLASSPCTVTILASTWLSSLSLCAWHSPSLQPSAQHT